jgi:hypothetical protein
MRPHRRLRRGGLGRAPAVIPSAGDTFNLPLYVDRSSSARLAFVSLGQPYVNPC